MITKDEAFEIIRHYAEKNTKENTGVFVQGFFTGYCNGLGYRPDWVEQVCEKAGISLSARVVRGDNHPMPPIKSESDYEDAQEFIKRLNQAEDSPEKQEALDEIMTLIAEYESKRVKHS